MGVPSTMTSDQQILNECILQGFGSLGARVVAGLKERILKDGLQLRIVAIVERDPGRISAARSRHPEIPCFNDIQTALNIVAGPGTFIKDCTSPIGRAQLLESARDRGIPVLLEKPLSTPGAEVSLAGYEHDASVSMSEAFNPVVQELARRLAADAAQIHSLAFARINSLTLERLHDPRARADVIGGAFVDKMSHDIHLLVSGTLLGSKVVEFSTPQIRETAFDLLAHEGTSKLTFSSLEGGPIPPSKIIGPGTRPAEMMADVSMEVRLNGRAVPTRWIASWCGVPDDLATRLRVPQAHVDAARMDNPGEATVAGRAAYPASNLKLIVCDYTNHDGEEVQLVCNIQGRGSTQAWMIERRNGVEHWSHIQHNVSVVESLHHFSQNFRCGKYLDLVDVLKADDIALEIRDQFRPPMPEELHVEYSLAMLERYNKGLCIEK